VIVTGVVGVLACLAGLAVLWPFTSGRAVLHADADPDEDLRRALLRQLRDLDDDLAAGKLTDAEHRALRAPVEAEAIAVLRRFEDRVGSGELSAGLREIRREAGSAASGDRPRRRWLRLAVGLGVAAAAVAGVGAVLATAVSHRGAADTITGASAAPGGTPSADPVVAAAEARVRRNPGDVAAYLDLARLYVATGRRDSAAIEYLAITRLQPTNPEANTALALLAFQSGEAAQAKRMLDGVLAAHPRYPGALYARGLVELVGLSDPAAERDLNAYLRMAPSGSHRSEALTLLATTRSTRGR
jgi:cytochrome c-type biogenesis protein CcmH/NrfG